MIRVLRISLFVFASCVAASPARSLAETVEVSSLDLTTATSGWGTAQANRSVMQSKLSIGGRAFETGVGVHAPSVLRVELGGSASRFSAHCGVDDDAGRQKGSVVFKVIADGKEVWKSPLMRGGDAGVPVDVDVHGVKRLLLVATDGGDGMHSDHADWVEAKLEVAHLRTAVPVADDLAFLAPEAAQVKLAGLARLGHVTGITKTEDGLIIKTNDGKIRITVCSAAVLRLQIARGENGAAAQQNIPGEKLVGKPDFSVAENGKEIMLKTAELQFSVARDSGALALLDKNGKVLFKEHGIGVQCAASGKDYTLEMGLGGDEHVFGHGDVIGPLDHRTLKNIRMKVEYRPRNVCVPFFMSTAGYGMFLNDSSQKLRFDYFGEKADGFYTASCEDGELDCFLIAGPSLKQIMGNYTGAVVGRAPLIPRYGFGVMWSMKEHCNYEQAMEAASRFRKEELPLDSVQFEPGPGYAAYIPKAAGKSEKETIADLTALNYKVAVWTGRYPHFWQDHKQWLDWGLSWITIDPYARDYNTNSSHDDDAFTVMKEFMELSGGRRPLISDCAGGIRAARHPSIRMCDRAGRTSTWQSMMSTAMTGVLYFFCDYWCTPEGGLYPGCPDDPKQNVRSRETIPQNMFLPTANGQSWSYKYVAGFPWEQGEEWMNDYRYFAKLRYRLLPYYYTLAADCTHFTGLPMTRPLALEFENDPKTYTVDSDEFMFGDSLLVAPAYANMKGSREVYLPVGARWIDYWSGQAFEGGQTVKLTIPEKGPDHLCGLYVRAGAIIPMGPEVTWIGTEVGRPAPQKPTDQLLLDIYPHGTSVFRLYEDDGATMNYTKGKYAVTPMKCQGLAETVIFTIEPRTGDYRPDARSYLMKFNGTFTPMEVSLNGDALTACKSYLELAAAKSGWFFGLGEPLIHGPQGFSLAPRPDTLWVKVKDTGKMLDIVAKKTE